MKRRQEKKIVKSFRETREDERAIVKSVTHEDFQSKVRLDQEIPSLLIPLSAVSVPQSILPALLFSEQKLKTRER